MQMLISFFIALLVLLQISLAEDYTLQSSVSWWNAASYRGLVESELNPDNGILKLPQWMGTSEIRPDVKFIRDSFVARGRPRLIGTLSKTTWGDTEESSETSGKIQWSEAYASLAAVEWLTITYGLQNFQWGPAEAAGPSNQIFHETIQAKDVLFDTRGHHLLRVNLTPMQELSEVLLVEISDNGDPEFIAEENFSKKFVLKSEYSWAGGADYAGLVLGHKDQSESWIGEYINLEIVEGLSLYLDASQQQGSSAWYPVKDANNTIVMTQSLKDSNHIYQYSVTGLRYVFENGNDIRLEWIFQEAGYGEAEIFWAWTALTSKNIVQLMLLQQNAARAQRNGLNFPGQDYLFTSLRIPDAFKFKDWTLYWRLLASVHDGSLSSLVSSENAVGEAGTLFATAAATAGKAESELRGSVDQAYTLGYRHTW
ncbi:MAG: hypothetical protein A2X86_08510 [Bdellovibrionales bacterium GWA2_49_15]|nr:MAG: hypothetical protein A2X86_08510 [Bdellovibrionales bacterium GWA2_49_15]HAZ11196.1 hypothetical protein [Bdellovibrionales bacterium]